MSLRGGLAHVCLGDGKTVVCDTRGKLKQTRKDDLREDIIAVGDLVMATLQAGGKGVIEEVLPRSRALIRMAPAARGKYKQVLLANPDQIVLVFSCASPAPRLRMLDRFLVICEEQGIDVVIAANKVDLVGIEAAQALFSNYTRIGYAVIYTSTVSGLGVDELAGRLKDRLSGMAGPSGVGKSSLLNAIQPSLELRISDVSEGTLKGRHTTVVRRLFALDKGGFVADMPGIRMLTLWDIEPEELDAYFPEMRELVADCFFSNCSHSNEPDCAVKEAVNKGIVHPERYESYLRMRFEDAESLLEDLELL